MSEYTREPGLRQRLADWLRRLPVKRRKLWLRRNARAERRAIRKALMILLVIFALYIIGSQVYLWIVEWKQQ